MFISLSDRIRAAVDIRSGESTALILLVAHAACMGLSNTFLDAAATAQFLSHFGVEQLPYIYIASAVTGVSFGFVISRLESRLRPTMLLGGTTAMLAAAVAAMYAGLLGGQSRWLAVVLMMWKDVQFILSAMALWATAGMLFDLRQGKRLFGLVGAGDIAAVIAGGLLVPVIVDFAGASQLLAAAAISQAGCLACFTATTRRHQQATSLGQGTDENPEALPDRGLLSMLRDPYLRPLFAISILSYLGYYFVDYGFYARVQQLYPDADSVARFYGYFLSATGAVNLLSNIFISGRVLTRYGVRAALLVLPAFVGAGVLISMAGATLGLAGVFVWATIGTKLVDEVFRKSIEGPTYRVLYQPLPRRDRLRVQAIRESVVEPFAIGFSGLTLLLVTRWLGVPATSLFWGVAVIVAAWLLVGRQVGAGYLLVLRAAIRRRRLDDPTQALRDETTHRLLREYLDDAAGPDLVYALRILEGSESSEVESRLVHALLHDDPIVREFAIGGCERRHVAKAAPILRRLIDEDSGPRLRGLALRAYCAIEGTDGCEVALRYLDAELPELRRESLAALARLRHPSAARLERLAASLEASDRLLAARVLEDSAIAEHRELVLALMQDEDPSVFRSAMLAAGRLADPRFLPYLLLQLEQPVRRPSAAAALIAMRDVAVPMLAGVLRESGASRGVRRQSARVLARIRTPLAVQALVDALPHTRHSLRGAILQALEGARWKPSAAQRRQLELLLDEEVHVLVESYAVIKAADEPALEAFREAVMRETIGGRGRVLAILALLINDRAFADARAALTSEAPERRAQGLEMIETLLPRGRRRAIVALLDDLPFADRAGRLVALIGHSPITPWERIEALVEAGDDDRVWLRAVAMRTAALTRDPRFGPAFEQSHRDGERLIRETAAWARDYRASPPAQ